MAGPSIMVRVLGDAVGLATTLETLGGKAKAAGATLHESFRTGLDMMNQAGVLGPFGQSLATADEQLSKIKGHGKEVGPVMVGAGGAVAGLGLALTTMGSKDQAAHQQLQAAVGATGHSYDQYAEKVDAAIKHQEHFGTTADTTQDALRTLTTATGDPTKALGLLNTATDLAADKGISLEAAASKLGKAYNGNARVFKEFGIQVDSAKKATSEMTKAQGEVSKSGAEMTKAQQHLSDVHAELAGKTTLTTAEQFKLRDAQAAVVKASGDQGKAQDDLKKAHDDVAAATNANGKAIDTLSSKLKGQAAASADTFGGKLKAMRAHATDAINTFGQKFGPALAGAGTAMAGLGTAVSVGGKAIKAMKDSQVLASAATKIWSGTQAVLNLVMDANPIMIVVLAVAAITAAIILAYTHCQTFRDVVKDMGKIAVDIFNGIKTVAMDVFHWISNNWPLLVGVLFGPFGLAVAIIATHINTVKGIVTGLISHITTAFSTVLGIITAPFSQAAAGISAAFSTAITFVQGIPGDITTALGDVTNLLYNAGKTIIDSLGRGIKDAFDAVKNFVGGIGSKIASLKGPLDYDRQLLVPAGSAIMQGLGRGLTQGFGRFVAPTLAETTRALSAAGGSSAPGSITTTTPVGGVKGRGGPAVVIQNVTVAAPMDVDSFMRRVSWEARRTGV